MTDLKKYICSIPFTTLEIHNNVYFFCCPSWLPKKIEASEYSIDEIWNSEPAIDIRNSIIDGSFKYCDKEMCPYLSKVIKFDVPNGMVGRKSDFNVTSPILKNNSPDEVIMNFDRTCNYKCPSCRVDLIVENSKGIERVEKTIDEIDNFYSKNIKRLYLTGTGDPFVSVGFRNYLRNFDPKKYPRLKNIHLHTNASMWNKEMWDTMSNAHKYIGSCEISIDAGTKETYENKTRIGGDWENLISNLKFINTLPYLSSIKVSFVVQDTNYMEMQKFYDIMFDIFGKKVRIFFGKITNWGTYNDGEFKIKKVWDINHPEHKLFLNEFDKVWKNPNVFHNLYEFIDTTKPKTLI